MQNHHSPGMTSLGLCWENGKLNGNYYLGFRILGMGSIAVSAIKNRYLKSAVLGYLEPFWDPQKMGNLIEAGKLPKEAVPSQNPAALNPRDGFGV